MVRVVLVRRASARAMAPSAEILFLPRLWKKKRNHERGREIRREVRKAEGARERRELCQIHKRKGKKLPNVLHFSHSKAVRAALERRASAKALAPSAEMLFLSRLRKILKSKIR